MGGATGSVEIERKFLVTEGAWRPSGDGVAFAQRYLSDDPDRTVRLRVAGDRAWLTVKGRMVGVTRPEEECEVPVASARAMMALCLPGGIEKVRHREVRGDVTWEVDVFGGANAGLVVAEVELTSEGQAFDRPGWLGEEVSLDARYLNVNLAVRPWPAWRDARP